MINKVTSRDVRFPLKEGAGSDAVHRDPVYSYAVTLLNQDQGPTGVGLSFTLGNGNDIVCQAIDYLSESLVDRDIEETMSQFGKWQQAAADDQQFRWLGPHKGVIHLALASITNACWDLWAKSRGIPLWKLLLDLSPRELVNTLDLSYLEDILTYDQAVSMVEEQIASRPDREGILEKGYPGYDTSVGWFNYSDEQIKENCRKALSSGFTALKLKVGSADMQRDLHRIELVRGIAGPDILLMVDANQQWTLPRALEFGQQSKDFDLYWIEEPTHPDDVFAHSTLAKSLAPTKLAAGEHVPNRIIFKNYLQSGCLGFCQVDALRVAGVSEFIVVSMLAKQFNTPVVPHVGDMGQIHQHLVFFNHIALGHQAHFLEYIPHLRERFVNPCQVIDGVYRCPQELGASSDLISLQEDV